MPVAFIIYASRFQASSKFLVEKLRNQFGRPVLSEKQAVQSIDREKAKFYKEQTYYDPTPNSCNARGCHVRGAPILMRRGFRAEVEGCGSVAFLRKRLAATPAEACGLGAGSSSASTISESSSPFVRPPPAAATATAEDGSRWMPFFSVVPAEEAAAAGCLAFFMSCGVGEAEVEEVDAKGRFEAAGAARG
ncbi:hypothetical protein EJB05_04159, partial [Eragrostis curvula]